MNETSHLAEQNILEWQSHLRHIDELTERARMARAKAPRASGLENLLSRAQQDRDRLAQHIDNVRGQPGDALPQLVEHGEGLKGALEAVGRQLEKALAAIIE